MSALPAGTVTFVFTDIEGSTELLKRLADRYGEVLSAHRRIVRDTFTAANGTEIDTQGDAFFFAFPRARDAVAAAVDVQREHAAQEWPDGCEVRVRIGLHTGEPAVAEEGYLGLDVVRAARICAAARGGNVLLSETTRALVGSSLPDGVSVFPLGERHLKGLDEPERMYELEIDGVSAPEPEPQPEPDSAAPAPSGKERGRDVERRAEDFALRLVDSIQERVFRSIEKSMGKSRPPSVEPRGDDENLDDLAARAATLEDKIRAQVDAALRASGVPREQT